MEAVISELKSKDSESSLVQETLVHLHELQQASGEARLSAWQAVRNDFDKLEADGIWEKTEEHANLLDAVNPHSTVLLGGRDISVVQPPASSTGHPALSTVFPVALPIELLDVLNHVYFLHVLATSPFDVLPPGKSLISMMSKPELQNHAEEAPIPQLKDKVESIVHRAFWDEAFESLSSPEPSKQVARLKFLYNDLLQALRPLLPNSHPIIEMLSSPLSPTSSPLLSTIHHLQEILVSLRQRCAPARDENVDSLIRMAEVTPSPHDVERLARLVVDLSRSILRLAEVLKDDLSQFLLGSMTERQLQLVIRQEARARERAIITELWKKNRIEESWRSWLQETQEQPVGSDESTQQTWMIRLIRAFALNIPVSCPLPTVSVTFDESGNVEDRRPTSDPVSGNVLPPPFFFSAPTLLRLQNYLQAIVIAGALRSLTYVPAVAMSPAIRPDSSSSSSYTEGPSHSMGFMERIWSLLSSEVDQTPGTGDTKVVNLADEVLRARQLSGPVDKEEEARLRAAVRRTLQPNDPAFSLLWKRLTNALVSSVSRDHPRPDTRASTSVPLNLRTGRNGERVGKRPRLILEAELDSNNQDELDVHVAQEHVLVKGFEDPVLVRAIDEAAVKIRKVIHWTTRLWPDLIVEGKLHLNVE